MTKDNETLMLSIATEMAQKTHPDWNERSATQQAVDIKNEMVRALITTKRMAAAYSFALTERDIETQEQIQSELIYYGFIPDPENEKTPLAAITQNDVLMNTEFKIRYMCGNRILYSYKSHFTPIVGGIINHSGSTYNTYFIRSIGNRFYLMCLPT